MKNEIDRRRFWSVAVPTRPLSDADKDAALKHLRNRAEGQLAVEHLVEVVTSKQARVHYGDPDAARRHLTLARALRQAGRITLAEYVLQVGSRLELVSDGRWEHGAYSSELDPIAAAMDEISKRHGLAEDEYWTIAEQPAEYRVLSEAYSKCLDDKLIETFREFGEYELAELKAVEPARYDRLREEGRRSVFEKDNHLSALSSLIDHYECEAKAAGWAGAYLAGCLMWGAAAEGRLLFWCLLDPETAEKSRQSLPRPDRPRKADPRDWTLDQLLQVAKAAGWLGVLEDEDFVFIVAALIENLRRSRNLVHPGRSLRDEPHLRRDKATFEDAQAAYAALRLNEADREPPITGRNSPGATDRKT
jgi:hypothetical protein